MKHRILRWLGLADIGDISRALGLAVEYGIELQRRRQASDNHWTRPYRNQKSIYFSLGGGRARSSKRDFSKEDEAAFDAYFKTRDLMNVKPRLRIDKNGYIQPLAKKKPRRKKK